MVDKLKIQINEDLEPIIPTFFKNLEQDIEISEFSILSADGEKVAKMGHKCKGACGSYGFMDMYNIFDLIEKNGLSGDFIEAQHNIQKLKQYISKIEIEYIEIDEDDDDE